MPPRSHHWWNEGQRGLNTKRPTIVFFLALTKPLPSYDQALRQARTGNTVLVKSKEIGRTQTLVAGGGGVGVKTTENKIQCPSWMRVTTKEETEIERRRGQG